MKDGKYHILAYHGWGFDGSIWEELRSKVEPFARFDSADRGYFSNPKQPKWKNNSESEIEKLLLVHSYGLHWCSNEILEKADHLILVSSFLNFHPSDEKSHKRSKLVLRKMQTQFVDSPRMVLERFYEDVFYPEDTELDVPKSLNHDRLLEDLGDLDRDNRQNAAVFDMNSITIIHGGQDQIVSNEMAREMYSKLRLRSQYFEIKKGGHAIVLTHSSKIFEILNSLFHFK